MKNIIREIKGLGSSQLEKKKTWGNYVFDLVPWKTKGDDFIIRKKVEKKLVKDWDYKLEKTCVWEREREDFV